jgi:hypothetical protein
MVVGFIGTLLLIIVIIVVLAVVGALTLVKKIL